MASWKTHVLYLIGIAVLASICFMQWFGGSKPEDNQADPIPRTGDAQWGKFSGQVVAKLTCSRYFCV